MQASTASQSGGRRQEGNLGGVTPSTVSRSGKHGENGGHYLDQEVLPSESRAATAVSIPEGVAQALQFTTREASSCGQQTVPGQEAAFVFHQANAYESEDGRSMIVDCIRYPSMPDFEQVQHFWLLHQSTAFA